MYKNTVLLVKNHPSTLLLFLFTVIAFMIEIIITIMIIIIIMTPKPGNTGLISSGG